MTVQLKFEPRDLWVGIYWDTGENCYERCVDIYLCLIPCFPLHVKAKFKEQNLPTTLELSKPPSPLIQLALALAGAKKFHYGYELPFNSDILFQFLSAYGISYRTYSIDDIPF